ncbi:hypothetical protein LguiA_021771 [Lonicera macranthoides]
MDWFIVFMYTCTWRRQQYVLIGFILGTILTVDICRDSHEKEEALKRETSSRERNQGVKEESIKRSSSQKLEEFYTMRQVNSYLYKHKRLFHVPFINYPCNHFTPSTKLFTFVNTLEVVLVPKTIITANVSIINNARVKFNGLPMQTLATIAKVNMGGFIVTPYNDILY